MNGDRTIKGTQNDAVSGKLDQLRIEFVIETDGRGFFEITSRVLQWLNDIGAKEGLLTVFVRHTSASLTIQENADPDVRADLMATLERLAPEEAGYRHTIEGPDDMPAHIKSMLRSVSLSIPVVAGRSALGMWQGIYLVEHRTAPHQRDVILHFVGTTD